MSDTIMKKALIVFTLIVIILMIPIGIYIYTFGLNITDDHMRWSEMGSAMSGIYTPIFTVFTLLVLLSQVGLQEKMNRHTFDQAFVQDARADIHFYLDQIAKEFTRTFQDGTSIGPILIDAFSHPTKQQLITPPLCDIAEALNKKHPGLLASWSAFYSVLAGTGTHDWYPYKNAHLAAKQKAIAMLSYGGCAALDNFTFSASKGRLQYSYEFSSALSSFYERAS